MGILRVVRQLHEQERMRTPAVVSRSQTAIFLLYLDGKNENRVRYTNHRKIKLHLGRDNRGREAVWLFETTLRR